MGRSRVAVVAMGRYGALCVAICAAGGRSRVAVMPMDAYGVGMYVCMRRQVPLGGAHE